MDSDLSNLPNHCASNQCSFCKERRERSRRRMVDAELAAMGVIPSPWETKLGGAGDVFGYWPMRVPPMTSDPLIRFMKTPSAGSRRRKIHRRHV